ncbi:hypothetical protein [Salinisphaera hydrothermalis]
MIADMAELLGLIVTTGQRLAQAHRAGCPVASGTGAAIDEPWQVRRHG